MHGADDMMEGGAVPPEGDEHPVSYTVVHASTHILTNHSQNPASPKPKSPQAGDKRKKVCPRCSD